MGQYYTLLCPQVQLGFTVYETNAISNFAVSITVFQELTGILSYECSPKDLLSHVLPQKLRQVYVIETNFILLRT